MIVDLTSSGTTLKDNRLREIEGGTVLESASCLIGHAPNLRELIAEGDDAPLARLLDAIDGARASEGRLHLEVVGATTDGPETAPRVAEFLQSRGALHVMRGEVWDARGSTSWRVTASVLATSLPSCTRTLYRLGATRVVGLPPRFVFDRDAASTFDTLRKKLL